MSLSEDVCSTTSIDPSTNTARLAESVSVQLGYRSYWSQAAEVFWIVLVMFVYAGRVSPDVNEPHYLGKAKHFWDATYCSGDFFYESQDAHAVFFWTFGQLTHWLSLPAASWVGRILGWTLLATAWYRLSNELMPRRGISLLTAVLWITLVDRGQMSGEWILGGIEAKVIAYAFVVLSVREMVADRWNRAWVCLGVATAFHVLVGGWAWLMAGFGIATLPSSERPSFRSFWGGAVIGLSVSMVALIPAIQLSNGVSTETVRQANLIYVFHRLSHHLLIRDFPVGLVVRHMLLVLVFLWLWRILREVPRIRCFFGFCGGGVAMMLVGALLDVLLGHTSFGMSWLRFYWFRATDVFTPAAVSLGLVYWMVYRIRSVASYTRIAGIALAGAVLLNLVWTVAVARSHRISPADWQSGITSVEQLRDWRDVCQWVERSLPNQAMFLTPGIQTFKWYAHRPEIVSWKDVPQDAKHIVEWSERVRSVRRWNASTTADDSAARLEQLHADYGFDFIVTHWPRQFSNPGWHPIYQNARYVVLAKLSRPPNDVHQEVGNTETP